jgi:F-type H+-transporting ATPase subunit epsilon
MTLQVELVSPERILYSGEAEMVIARTVDGGDIAFLTGHAPFVGALEINKLVVRPEGGADEVFGVYGGFIEVRDNRVTVLSDDAERAEDIDVEHARELKEDAERKLMETDDILIEAQLRRAHCALELAGHI